jgi:hypothetical protein
MLGSVNRPRGADGSISLSFEIDQRSMRRVDEPQNWTMTGEDLVGGICARMQIPTALPVLVQHKSL